MCEFCTKHGEGQKWYLVMRNYSRELWEQPGRRDFAEYFWSQFEDYVKQTALVDTFKDIPVLGRLVRLAANHRMRDEHIGQVVPIEEVDHIIDMQSSIVRLPCECRRMTTGRADARYCFGLGVDRRGVLGKYPDLSHSLELLDKEEAKELVHSFDRRGLLHSVWTMKTPYISSLCNCDQDCVAYRISFKTGVMKNLYRAEYVALADWELCNGCKKCLPQCQFGAIQYSFTMKRPTIDMMQCWGCGVCRAVCDKEAITLRPRTDFARLPW